MKKLFFIAIGVFFVCSSNVYSATAPEIMSFFDYDHGKLLDFYWVRPRQIYDQWSNASRFTTSHFKATYVRRDDISPIFESFKDYLDRTPVSREHTLNYEVIIDQSYKSEILPIMNEYEEKEKNGTLKIVHRVHGFNIGEFDEDGRFNGAHDNVGMIDLTLWNQVFYDPWDQKMYFRRFIEKPEEREPSVQYTANPDGFRFKFKDDPEGVVRFGKMELRLISGFKEPVEVFSAEGHILPLSREMKIQGDMNRPKNTVSYDAYYMFNERELWIDPEGIVRLEKTYTEFMFP